MLLAADILVHPGDDLVVVAAPARACDIVADGGGGITGIRIHKLVAKDY